MKAGSRTLIILPGWGNMPVNIKCSARCPKDIQQGNMGVGALKSHAGGAKHESKLKAREHHTCFHYYCIQALCVHTLLINTIRYHSWILATLYFETFNNKEVILFL